MVISDAQVHIWGADTPVRPWPADGHARAQRAVPLGVEELIREMDNAGVDRAVIVPPSWEGDRNDLALDAARQHPSRLAVMGRLDLKSHGTRSLRRWRDLPGMLGVRLTFHTDVGVDDAEWFWPEAADAGLPVMIFGPGQTAAFGEVAKRFPDLRLIVDHLNLRTGASLADLDSALEALLKLSDLSNLAIKISALPCLLGPGESVESLAPFIRRVIDAYGADRTMWGSDLSRLPIPYIDWVTAGTSGFNCLSPTEIAQVMGASLATWLDWPEEPT